MSQQPINILGAGPSGLAAAIAFAQEGREVHVHERYDSAGKRFLGDLQGLENWSTGKNVISQIKSFGIEINFEATPFYEITLTNGLHSFKRSSKEPLFYLVKRGTMPDSLDKGLEEQALKRNVNIHYRSKFAAESADVIATGPIKSAVVAMDKGFIFKTDLPNVAIGIFHDDYAYKGYSYLLVANGFGCICSVVFKDLHLLNGCFEKTIELVNKMYDINLKDAHPVGGIGSFRLNSAKEDGSACYVGESAGLQDFLWGFGIRTAITSGFMAAQSHIEKKNYTQSYQKHFQNYMKAGVVNRYLWEKIKIGSTPLIPYFMLFPASLRTNFWLLYKYTPLHQLLYPIAYRYIKTHYPASIDF